MDRSPGEIPTRPLVNRGGTPLVVASFNRGDTMASGTDRGLPRSGRHIASVPHLLDTTTQRRERRLEATGLAVGTREAEAEAQGSMKAKTRSDGESGGRTATAASTSS